MNHPRFTFCIPNLNKRKYLPACIQSVLQQDCPDWCCVFVDGYSNDGSWEYMQQFASDRRFRLLRGLRQGMYADWNECLKQVETEYFYILTSDDTCFPTLASRTIAALDAFPQVDACHFQFDLIDQMGAVETAYPDLIQRAFGLYSKINHFPHLRCGLTEFMLHFVYRALYQTITSLVLRRNVIGKVGGFSTDYGAIADFDWTMRLGLYTDILYIPERLATWRVYPEQATEDCMLPHITEKLLEIADKNLTQFQLSEKFQRVRPAIDRDLLLSDLRDEHACSLYRDSTSASATNWQSCLSLVKHYPTYPVKKLLNRFSYNQLFPYRGRTTFANQLMQMYELPEPELIELKQSVPILA